MLLDPRWLSSTVIDLTKALIDEPTVDRLPILSDCLMDYGCDDEELTTYLKTRGEEWPRILKCYSIAWAAKHKQNPDAVDVLEWLSRCSKMPGEVDRAWADLVTFGEAIGSPGSGYDDDLDDLDASRRGRKSSNEPTTPETLVEYASQRNNDPGESYGSSGYRFKNAEHLHMGSNESYKDIPMSTFWKAYEILTGEIADDPEDSFFSCGC